MSEVPADRPEQRREQHVGGDEPGAVLIRPPPTVCATLVDVNAPSEVHDRRDQRRPCAGCSARVETDVATALAVSWKPFVKSNASAIATTTTSSAVAQRFFR